MITGPVIVLVVSDRADDRQLVADGRQTRHVLREQHPGDARVDGIELATNLERRIGLGIEGFEVTGAPIEPEENATRRHRAVATRESAGTDCVRESASQQRAEAEFQTVAAVESFAVVVNRHIGLTSINKVEFGCIQQGPEKIFNRQPTLPFVGKDE